MALVKRNVEPLVKELLAHAPAVIIEGARQVGKSTLATQVLDNPLVCSLDIAQQFGAAREDPVGLIAQAGKRPTVIDEIQLLPELTLAVKSSIDQDRRPGRFILTGSSSLLRVRGLADSLAGRAIRVPLFGLSQGELAGVRDDFVSAISSGAPSIEMGEQIGPMERAVYAALICRGAYPETQKMPPQVLRRWQDSYLDAVVRRDLPVLRREVAPARADAILRSVAAIQAGELVKARLAVETDVPAGTMTGYLDLLQDVGLIATIPPWTPNLTQREVGRRKVVVLDSGLAARLVRATPELLPTTAYASMFGSLLEGFVASELLRQQTWTETEFELFHYRDRAGSEVDLILELVGGLVIAIEVKAAQSFNARQFSGLRTLRDRLGERFLAGIVLNTGLHGYRFADRLYGLPISALWAR